MNDSDAPRRSSDAGSVAVSSDRPRRGLDSRDGRAVAWLARVALSVSCRLLRPNDVVTLRDLGLPAPELSSTHRSPRTLLPFGAAGCPSAMTGAGLWAFVLGVRGMTRSIATADRSPPRSVPEQAPNSRLNPLSLVSSGQPSEEGRLRPAPIARFAESAQSEAPRTVESSARTPPRARAPGSRCEPKPVRALTADGQVRSVDPSRRLSITRFEPAASITQPLLHQRRQDTSC